MSQTNRIPAGFLDLVGAETGGKNPPQYADFLQPALEMFELYAAQTLTALNTTFPTAAAGDVFETPVPTDEFWLIRSVSVRTQLPLTTDFERWSLRVSEFPRAEPSQAAGFPSIWTSRLMQVQTNATLAEDSFSIPSPFVVGPGVTLEFFLSERDAGAGRTTRAQLLINRFSPTLA